MHNPQQQKTKKEYWFDPSDLPPVSSYSEDDGVHTALCDNCPGGIKLYPFEHIKLICPECNQVYNPQWEKIKHKIIETTMDEVDEFIGGDLEFLSDEQNTTRQKITPIRQKLEEDDAPEYVKKEIERIQWRPGYKRVPINKNLFGQE